MKIFTRDERVLEATLERMYPAFEGGMRYIMKASDGKEYRCVTDEKGRYVEYVC